MRQIILDTETTGLDPTQGHRIIEIGCIEIIDRQVTDNYYHQYINPEREVDQGAFNVHGLSNQFLTDKPKFVEICDQFIEYVNGAELIIHNAPFDVGFINHEFKLLRKQITDISHYCKIFDTLKLARELHPGKKNSLDALCKRYAIDNSSRDLHGALLDSQLLANVYLAMTGGQDSLFDEIKPAKNENNTETSVAQFQAERKALPIIQANEEELAAHKKYLEMLGDECVWESS